MKQEDDEVLSEYSTYVHIENSGYTFEVIIEEDERGYSQHLVTSLHAFGREHETKLHLDDNIIEALEYIIDRAKLQRSAKGWEDELKERHQFTHRPSHLSGDNLQGDSSSE